MAALLGLMSRRAEDRGSRRAQTRYWRANDNARTGCRVDTATPFRAGDCTARERQRVVLFFSQRPFHSPLMAPAAESCRRRSMRRRCAHQWCRSLLRVGIRDQRSGRVKRRRRSKQRWAVARSALPGRRKRGRSPRSGLVACLLVWLGDRPGTGNPVQSARPARSKR